MKITIVEAILYVVTSTKCDTVDKRWSDSLDEKNSKNKKKCQLNRYTECSKIYVLTHVHMFT